VLARVETLRPAGVVWLWPDPRRAPVPVNADNVAQWLARWSEGKAVYVSGVSHMPSFWRQKSSHRAAAWAECLKPVPDYA
jgi:hypothetical protein